MDIFNIVNFNVVVQSINDNRIKDILKCQSLIKQLFQNN